MTFLRTAALAQLLLTALPPVLSQGCHGPPESRLGAVASECDICSGIGTRLLQEGGNAVDAAVATTFCVGTVGMYHSGLGGGGFLVVRSQNGSYEYVDFRERAPAAAYEDMYVDDPGQSLWGGLASGVPGEARGLEYVHSKYGALPWKDVLAPSIQLARFGWEVNQDLIYYMNAVGGDFLTDDPTWAIDFAPHGKRLELGETITRKRYANTLEAIAEGGADAFYNGAIANATIAALTRLNGTMVLDDLRNYTVTLRPTAEITYRGYKLTSATAPSSGIVVLSALNAADGFDGFGDPDNVNVTTQRLDQATKFAYGMRSSLGDPLYVDGLSDYMRSMVSPQTGAEVRSKISDTRTYNTSYYDPSGLESLDTPGTAHIVAADHTGLAVSLTTTINLLFGSQVMIPETGVIMNNEMNDFSIPGVTNAFGYEPSPSNFIRPGKRPLSSMSPTIVETEEGKVYFLIGAAGGSRIITSTIQNIHHVIDNELNVADALAEPRWHDQLTPNEMTFEWAFDNATVAHLRNIGHQVRWVAPGQSAAQGVRLLRNGTFEAAGEPRQANSGGFAV
ncbi:gamma-glutamyltranspeptidase [Sodiomyces alkalinus F11]|uniref:Glutathione hydrolase n=1 Tax=Sodiomyces alkalinus (strain CBS 110278 / VKM F-3762 / F11) TaxID=1314773 RepID=A0A3N2PPQ2_SODAK|nr:gamma-glutamyltranspeptidase [Sodiomyces alkalinus F11]ROT36482.1 gamma-glutamyltranspeptidase [Sodiomyces alkalinus F11]